MIPASLRFPAGRDLRGLWQEFAGLSPSAIHTGFLLLHHLDAPVSVRTPVKLAPFEAAALDALRLSEPASAAQVDSLLCLGPGLAAQLLERLHECGLAERAAPDRWQASARARQAAGGLETDCFAPVRREFHFVDSQAGAPQFIVPPPGVAAPLHDPGEWRFDLRALKECIARDDAWKVQHGFPCDVSRLDEAAGARVNCTGVVVDRAEALAIALVTAARALLACLDSRTWKPVPSAPWEYASAAEAHAAVGLKVEEFTAEAGRAAWLEWAGRHGVGERDAAACKAQVAGVRLEVKAPRTLVNRLQHGSSPEGEFLLAGAGLVRRMLRIELRAS